jgi:hypothetical protein
VAAVLWNLGLLVIPVTLVVSLVLTIRGAYVTRFANRLGSHHSLAS